MNGDQLFYFCVRSCGWGTSCKQFLPWPIMRDTSCEKSQNVTQIYVRNEHLPILLLKNGDIGWKLLTNEHFSHLVWLLPKNGLNVAGTELSPGRVSFVFYSQLIRGNRKYTQIGKRLSLLKTKRDFVDSVGRRDKKTLMPGDSVGKDNKSWRCSKS